MLFPLQDAIIQSTALVSTMEAGASKTSAIAALARMSKSDDEMRKQLFFLQVWKKHGRVAAVKFAKRKRGEYLDNDLAKVLEDEDKIKARTERDLAAARERAASLASLTKRPKYSPTNNYPGAGSSGGNRGGKGYLQGRRGHAQGGQQTTPKKPKKCYLCNAIGHFVRNCPNKDK